MNYADKLKDPRWQKKRLEILQRDNFTCQLCNDKETTLHVHHKEYYNNPWDAKEEMLITYCEHCHLFIEHLKNLKFTYPKKVFKSASANKNHVTIFCSSEEILQCQPNISLWCVIDGKVDLLTAIHIIGLKTIIDLIGYEKIIGRK